MKFISTARTIAELLQDEQTARALNSTSACAQDLRAMLVRDMYAAADDAQQLLIRLCDDVVALQRRVAALERQLHEVSATVPWRPGNDPAQHGC